MRESTKDETRLGKMAFDAAKRLTGAGWAWMTTEIIEAIVSSQVLSIATAQVREEISVEWLNQIHGVAIDLVREHVKPK
jgi:hypothetical protein